MATRSLARARYFAQAGFTAAELIVVVGIVGILAAASTPFFLSVLQTSRLRAGAEEMSTVLNRARQLAIRENTSMCVARSGTGLEYRIGSCAVAAPKWTGPGTDGAGLIQLANNITVTNGPDVLFSYIGTATGTGTYTVTNPLNASTLSVIVTPSGRVSLGP